MAIDHTPVCAASARIVAVISPEPRALFVAQEPAPVTGPGAATTDGRPDPDAAVDLGQRAEEALRASEERFRLATQSLSDVVYDWDLEDKVDWYGDVDSLMGYPRGGFPRTLAGWRATLHPEDQPRVLAALEAQIKSAAPYDVEYRVKRKDGGWRWWQARGAVVRDARGEPCRMIGAITDVTDRRQAEYGLRESEERYRILFESSLDALMTLEPPSWRFTSGNASTVAMFGARDEADFVARAPWEYSPERQPDGSASAAAAKEMIETAMRAGSHFFEWTHQRLSGEEFRATVLLTRIALAGQPLLQATVRDITASKRAEAALRASEERYDALFKRSLNLVFVTDLEGRFIDANDAALDRLGYTRAELPSLNFAALLSADQLPQALATLAETLKTGVQRGVTEFRLRHKDGRDVHVETQGAIVFSNGAPVAFQAVARDITARRHAEAALRESEERFRSLVDNTGEGIGIVDLEDRFVYANGSADAVFGMPAGGLVGHSLSEFVAPEVFATFGEITLARRRGESKHYQIDIKRPDGSERTLMVTSTTQFDARDEPQGSYGVFRDITARSRMVEALQESEARFKAVFDSATDGLLLTDPATRRLVVANRAMCEMLGYSEKGLVGLEIKDIHPESALPLIEEVAGQLARGDTAPHHDLPLKRKDGTVFFADVNGTQVRLGGRAFMLGSFRDVTEKRRMEASLAQSDRLASMGMLAAGVAHEINNPLSYLLNNVESLAEDLPKLAGAVERGCAALRDRVGDAVVTELAGDGIAMLQSDMLADVVDRAREALDGARRIREIARGLGTFSRVEQVECAAVDLNSAIAQAVTMAHNEIKYRARLVTDLGPVPAVWASAGKLAQVFLNLIINAGHAIDGGDAEHHRIGIRTWVEGQAVLAEVTDTGKGMPPETLERIFEPFFTTKKVGTGSGLGLAICRNIVTGFGGDIRVESQLGKGTRFVIRLPMPVEAPQAPPDETAPALSAPPTVRGRILVVDDEAAIRRSMQRLLGRVHEVVTAASGAEARAILERDQAFDLVLCDLMMPEMSGMDLHAWLAQHEPALAAQVVFVTGGAFTPRASEYVARVGNLRIEKPFDAANLAKVVAELVVAAKSK